MPELDVTYLDCQTGANHTQPQRILLRLTVTAIPERDLPHLGQPESCLDCRTIPSLDTLYHAETRLPHLVALATLRSSCSRLLVIGALALVIAVLETPLSKLSASN